MKRIRLSVVSQVLIALISISAYAQAQTREITGRVTTTVNGQPIPGAVVALPGQTAGVRTNERGEFRIMVPDGEVTIIARAIGYKRVAQRVPAGSATTDFALDKDVLELEGVI